MSKQTPPDAEFLKLLTACQEISGAFADGIVYIGGIAVYIHAINTDDARQFAEFTHDADFYISISDLADLRDLEEITQNRRLSKHQLTKRGFEFDIYTERYSSLIVPYDEVIAYATTYDNLKIASLEHLFVLKLEAYRDRFASTKGQKDARDLIRIAIVSAATHASFDTALVCKYLSDEHLALLERVRQGPEFLALAQGNAKQAKELRSHFTSLSEALLKNVRN